MCVKVFELENAVIKSIERGGGGIQFEYQVEKDKRQRKKPRETDSANKCFPRKMETAEKKYLSTQGFSKGFKLQRPRKS